MARSPSRLLRWFLILAAAALVVFLTRGLWLAALGGFLVRAEGPDRADLAVVLAGDFYGYRILKAAELVRQGYVPKVLVSGPGGAYDQFECDLAIAFAVRRGEPAAWFVRLPNQANSTREEADAVLGELRRLQVRKVLLVTSDYHTRRAGAIYHSLSTDLQFRVVAAPDQFFRADSWWRTRPGRKQFVFEWIKTFGDWWGL